MPEDLMGGAADVQANMAGQDQGQAAPENISDAVKLYQQQNAAAANGNMVPGGEGGQEPGSQEGSDEVPASDPEPMAGRTGESLGGSADVQQGIGEVHEAGTPAPQGVTPSSQQMPDGVPTRDAYIKQLTNEAVQEATRMFRDNDIQKYNISMLYDRDENTGQVSFRNPDNPNRPFESRSEAQKWIDSMNAQIDAEFNKLVMDTQQRMIQEQQPSIALLEFMPTFYKMSQEEQQVLGDLISPYAIMRGNDCVGFNCDLNIAAQQARAIAGRYAQATQQPAAQPAQQPASGPALDMKSGASQAKDEKAPTNIQEAMAMYAKKEKEKKGKK